MHCITRMIPSPPLPALAALPTAGLAVRRFSLVPGPPIHGRETLRSEALRQENVPYFRTRCLRRGGAVGSSRPKGSTAPVCGVAFAGSARKRYRSPQVPRAPNVLKRLWPSASAIRPSPAPFCWLIMPTPLPGTADRTALKSMIAHTCCVVSGKPNTLTHLTSLAVSTITQSCTSLAVGLRRCGNTNKNEIFQMRAGAIRSSLQGPDASKGRDSLGTVLPREVLVWALSARTQPFRIPFDEKLVTGQMPPPYGINAIVLAADLLGLRAAWAKRRASALRKLVAPFLVLVSPALREPHNGLVAGRESLASLDSAAPNQRLAFFLCIKANRVDFNGAAPVS